LNIKKITEYLFSELSKISRNPEEITRLPFSDENEQAIIFIKNYMKKLGKKVYVDDFGNVVSHSEHTGKKFVFVSHYDSVPCGGKYDGIAGIVFGLALLNEIKDTKLFDRIEVIAFNNEESSRFGKASLGSKYFLNKLDNYNFKSLIENESTIDELIKQYNFSKYSEIKKPDYKAGSHFFEVHIDQTFELFDNNVMVGIVDKIAGHIRMVIKTRGKVDHSGLIDIEKRKNSLLPAAETILYCRKMSEKYSPEGIVSTVTRVNNSPNVTNMIPGYTEIFIDIRGIELSGMNEVQSEIIRKIKDNDYKYKTNSEIEIISRNLPAEMNRKMIKKFVKIFSRNNLPAKVLNSVAWHDIAEITDFFDSNLLFVQNPSGRSHCPEEDMNFEAFVSLLKVFANDSGDLIDN